MSPETRAKIEAAAEKLSYKPTILPRILQTGLSSIVAVVAGGLYNPFFTAALDTFADRLRDAGKQIMLVKASSDGTLDEIVDDLARYRVDAVVSALSIGSEVSATRLAEFRIPIVNLNSGFTGGWLRSVSSDNRAGGWQAAQLLHSLGRTRLCYLAGYDSTPQQDRQAGFLEACARVKLPVERVAAGFDYEDGKRAASTLFAKTERPDAVFCVNDLVACGAMDALRFDLGLRIPEDVAVIGFDDIPMAAWSAYRLTTFDQDVAALVEGVMTMLDGSVEEPALVLPPRLIERATTSRSPS